MGNLMKDHLSKYVHNRSVTASYRQHNSMHLLDSKRGFS